MTFFVLCDTCIVIDGIDSVTFFGLGSDEKRALQISDTTMIAKKIVTKKTYFCQSIYFCPTGDECIFVIRTSQNAKYKENNYFCDINRTSPKVKSLVVNASLSRVNSRAAEDEQMFQNMQSLGESMIQPAPPMLFSSPPPTTILLVT